MSKLPKCGITGCQGCGWPGDFEGQIAALEAAIQVKDEALKYCAEVNLDGLHSVKRVSHDALALTPDSLKARIDADEAVIDGAQEVLKAWNNGTLVTSRVLMDLFDALDARRKVRGA